MTYVSYVILGLTAGFLSALLGVGGGVIFVPAMLILVTTDFAHARAASLAFIVPIAVIGAFKYRDSLDLKIVAVAVPFGILGIELGVRLSRCMSDAALKRVCGVLVLLLGLKLLCFPDGWGGLFGSPKPPAGGPAAVSAPTAETNDGS